MRQNKHVYMESFLRGNTERRNKRRIFVALNVSFKHIFGFRIFLCCFLNTSLVVRFREAQLELVVEFE
jgi:hypothetical protein